MYIQDKVEEYADEVFDLLDNGAHIYFCGLKGMMPGTALIPCVVFFVPVIQFFVVLLLLPHFGVCQYWHPRWHGSW